MKCLTLFACFVVVLSTPAQAQQVELFNKTKPEVEARLPARFKLLGKRPNMYLWTPSLGPAMEYVYSSTSCHDSVLTYSFNSAGKCVAISKEVPAQRLAELKRELESKNRYIGTFPDVTAGFYYLSRKGNYLTRLEETGNSATIYTEQKPKKPEDEDLRALLKGKLDE